MAFRRPLNTVETWHNLPLKHSSRHYLEARETRDSRNVIYWPRARNMLDETLADSNSQLHTTWLWPSSHRNTILESKWQWNRACLAPSLWFIPCCIAVTAKSRSQIPRPGIRPHQSEAQCLELETSLKRSSGWDGTKIVCARHYLSGTDRQIAFVEEF